MTTATKIKICGITNEADGIEAARLGADFLGFIFYPFSPRYVEPKRAADIITAIRRVCVDMEPPKMIGVFVDESAEHIAAVRAEAGLDGAQMSGDESPEMVAQVAPIRFRGISLVTLGRLGRYEAEAYLCDTHAPVEKRGNGGVLIIMTRFFPILRGGIGLSLRGA